MEFLLPNCMKGYALWIFSNHFDNNLFFMEEYDATGKFFPSKIVPKLQPWKKFFKKLVTHIDITFVNEAILYIELR